VERGKRKTRNNGRDKERGRKKGERGKLKVENKE
jgi:hypothetical protein